jgi:hypothetical protein
MSESWIRSLIGSFFSNHENSLSPGSTLVLPHHGVHAKFDI